MSIRKTHKASFSTYKQRGEWVELLFMTRAVARGFNAAKPWGDSARFDIMLEHNGRLIRVQVKGTDRWNGSSYCCALYSAHQKAYTTEQIDYFAIYLIPDDIWYLFPGKQLAGQTAVVLSTHSKGHKHARYKEAWDRLESRSRPRVRRCTTPPRLIKTQTRSRKTGA